MLKLGLVGEPEVLGPQALEEYSRLFTKPLSRSHVAVLATLFEWHVPVSGAYRISEGRDGGCCFFGRLEQGSCRWVEV
jgi:hypothetical protein